MQSMPFKTSISIHQDTRKRLFQTRGKMEFKDGKNRSLEDVMNELIDYFEGGKKKLQELIQDLDDFLVQWLWEDSGRYLSQDLDILLEWREKFEELI